MADWIQKLQDSLRHTIEFVKESWQELQKVHWPSSKETYAATALVIIVVVLVSVYLAIIDLGLTTVIQAIIE
jgi:preprotein translocase subunit SecE